MKYVHRIGLRPTALQKQRLEELGVKLGQGIGLPGETELLFAFDVDEDHPNWPILQELFTQWRVSDIVWTTYTKREIDTARWLDLRSDWHHGYPQPDELDFGYREATFDLIDFCQRCGTGLKQKASFQMKGEPKWGKRTILQMNWVFDEYFVTPEVWSSVFEPHGIGCRPVTNRKGVELKTVVQLVVEEEVGIEMDGVQGEVCPDCGRTKYLPWTRGPFPALRSEPSGVMVKTREYFGSGGSANKAVLVSQALARAFTREKMRGASFWPVAEQSSGV
jgi:hypothetical protein